MEEQLCLHIDSQHVKHLPFTLGQHARSSINLELLDLVKNMSRILYKVGENLLLH